VNEVATIEDARTGNLRGPEKRISAVVGGCSFASLCSQWCWVGLLLVAMNLSM